MYVLSRLALCFENGGGHILAQRHSIYMYINGKIYLYARNEMIEDEKTAG